MWSRIDHGLLIGWALLMVAGIVANYLLVASYLARDVPYSDAPNWGRRAGYVTFCLGMLWASAMFAFYGDGSVPQKIFLITIMISLGTSRLLGGVYWFPLYYLYAFPIMGALAIRLAMEGGLPYIALAGLMLVGLSFIAMIARRLHDVVHSEMCLRHESAELSRALALKTEEAEKATLAKSRFLAAASHDLRQPLHALSLFVDVLRESKSDAERAAIFPRLELSLEALQKLFDALLDVSRLDAGVVTPRIAHFDVVRLLESLADEFRPAANKKGLNLRVHAGPSVVVSDPLLLERVLCNLITNAIRYTSSGGILLSTRSRGDRVLLQVWDTGMGIPRESHEEVFVEFHQLHNAHRDRSEGVGLGLALVKRLCLLLNHPLTLASRPGRGSVFSLSLPGGSASLLAREEATEPAYSWDLSGRRILVIDDERAILEAMHIRLSKWGCEVVTAESLDEAVSTLHRCRLKPDLLLSDLRLRDGKSGIEAIDSLRRLYGRSIPGILITGDIASEQIRAAKESGYEVLQKPVHPAHLRTVIQHHLSGSA